MTFRTLAATTRGMQWVESAVPSLLRHSRALHLSSACNSTTTASPSSSLAREVLQRAPFVVFAKQAPAEQLSDVVSRDPVPGTAGGYDADLDFMYFYFNDAMGFESGLSPKELVGGGPDGSPRRNAKTDFPTDYAQYFEDDMAVMEGYPAPLVRDSYCLAIPHLVHQC